MHHRALGRTEWKVSEISFGAWAIGGSWGQVSDEESMAALHKAIDHGVNFIDTAEVYGGGRSERLIARLKKERKERGKDKDEIIVATKAGGACRARRSRATVARTFRRGSKTAWEIFPPRGSTWSSFTAPRRSFIRVPRSSGFSTIWSVRGKFATTASAEKK